MKGKNFFIKFFCLLNLGCSSEKMIVEKVSDLVDRSQFNGVIMIYKANTPLYIKAKGFRDFSTKTPFSLDDQFLVGSITKQVVGMTVLDLIDNLPLDLHKRLTHTVTGEFVYSSQGYNEVASIIAENTKTKFDELLMKTAKKGGMLHASLQPSHTDCSHQELLIHAPALVKGYDFRMQEEYQPFCKRSLTENAAGGIIASARDLIYWNESLYERKIWSDEKIATLLKPRVKFPHRVGELNYGYGIQTTENPLEYSHNGCVRGFLSTLMYYPDYKINVVILENIFWSKDGQEPDFSRHDKIREIIRQNLF